MKTLTVALAVLAMAMMGNTGCDPDSVEVGGESEAIGTAFGLNLADFDHERIHRLEFVVELQARQIDTLLGCLSQDTWESDPCLTTFGIHPTQID